MHWRETPVATGACRGAFSFQRRQPLGGERLSLVCPETSIVNAEYRDLIGKGWRSGSSSLKSAAPAEERDGRRGNGKLHQSPSAHSRRTGHRIPTVDVSNRLCTDVHLEGSDGF